MERTRTSHEETPAPHPPADAVLAKKQQIRALKRVLVAKAEVRRLRSLLGRRRVSAR
jgi:hypothetical protein